MSKSPTKRISLFFNTKDTNTRNNKIINKGSVGKDKSKELPIYSLILTDKGVAKTITQNTFSKLKKKYNIPKTIIGNNAIQ